MTDGSICLDSRISIHALLAESDILYPLETLIILPFLSTLSLRRATALGLLGWLRVLISIHALLAESDISCARSASKLADFYPRSPCGERRLNLPSRPIDKNISIHALLAESDRQNYECFEWIKEFLSTLSLRRATACLPACVVGAPISIHALLAESDGFGSARLVACAYFYPRSPCGERPLCRTVSFSA